jgi:hypothetical protein
MAKLTVTVARIYAEQAFKEIRDEREKMAKSKKELLKSSPAFKALNEAKRLSDTYYLKFKKAKDSFEKRNGVSVSDWGKGKNLEISLRRDELPIVTDLKEEILIANHIDGVAPDKVVAHVIKKRKA